MLLRFVLKILWTLPSRQDWQPLVCENMLAFASVRRFRAATATKGVKGLYKSHYMRAARLPVLPRWTPWNFALIKRDGMPAMLAWSEFFIW